MKGTILLLSILLLGINSFSQDEVSIRSPHYFGVHAGTTTAYGLSYRYWPKKIGIEFTTIPYFKQTFTYIKNSKFIDSQISTGLCFLYKINQGKFVDYFTYIGGNTLFKKHHDAINPDSNYDNQIIVKKENLSVNMGVGLGVRFRFLQVMDFNLQLGYGFYNLNRTEDFYTLIALEGGLYYRF